eukprot:m.979467 g.979467  ORF g.979467 m.979467 type:complete len:431 (-) comp23961_c0_seq53:2783-4075(-)
MQEQSVDELDLETTEALHVSIVDFVKQQIPNVTSFVLDNLAVIPFKVATLRSHMECCRKVVKVWCDLMESKDFALEDVPEHAPSRLDIAKHYDIVFSKNTARSAAKLQQTPYGFGTHLLFLDDEAIARVVQKSSSETAEEINVTIGIAFRLKPLRETVQFCKQRDLKNKSKVTCANRLAKESMGNGFDCVDKWMGEPEHPSVLARTFWYPDAFVPLAEGIIKLQYACCICAEMTRKQEGILCTTGHFTCSECFVGYVKAAEEQGAIARSADDAGNVTCPECSEKFTLQYVAQHTPPASEIFRAMHNLGIVEKILTLRCPRCSTAFVDFDGCLALTCCKNTCRCGFCAWCLVDCGDDAHAHVPRCPERPPGDNLFGRKKDFDEHHRKRKARALQTYMKKPRSESVQQLLWDLLVEVGIDLQVATQPWWQQL